METDQQDGKNRQEEGHKTDDVSDSPSNHCPLRTMPIHRAMIYLVLGTHRAPVLKMLSLGFLSLMPLNI